MKIGTTRIETLSDGVIAIIITIMVLEFKVPEYNEKITARDVLANLHHLLPYFIIYAFSFIMVAILWTNHHHMFHLLEKADEYLLWTNFLFLFFMSLIPFATRIVGENPFLSISPAIYGLNMLLTTVSFALMRRHSLRKKLVHRDKNRELTVQIFRASIKASTKTIVATLVYLVSIPLAFVHVFLAYACFVVPVILFFIPEGIDNEELAERVDQKNTAL
ncbi:MAG: DUF1211 domain-containing protein [Williamsia sp.]|nr:DUF1211 domain-containing protein [Williamsia sp.]